MSPLLSLGSRESVSSGQQSNQWERPASPTSACFVNNSFKRCLGGLRREAMPSQEVCMVLSPWPGVYLGDSNQGFCHYDFPVSALLSTLGKARSLSLPMDTQPRVKHRDGSPQKRATAGL